MVWETQWRKIALWKFFKIYVLLITKQLINLKKAYKVPLVINHLNKAFQDAMSDAERQSTDEHMAKFKGWMSCKQYMKNKPIKWGFKWWYRCCRKTGYLHEFDLYLGKKDKTKLGLGETVVLDLSKKLENTHCMLYFDNFFNSPTLLEKIFDRRIYCLHTVRSDRKIWLLCKEIKIWKEVTSIFNMPITWLLWNGSIIDNHGVTMVGTCLDSYMYQQLHVE